MGGAKAHYDGIVAFSQTDFTEDLKKITVPVLVMHSEDDQIVPYADAGPLSAKLLKNGTLKTYKGFPHGMPTTEAETINTDLLAFIEQEGISTREDHEDRSHWWQRPDRIQGGSEAPQEGAIEVIAASPSTGVDTITGEGLADAFRGAEVGVDLSNSPSFEEKAATEFFVTSGRNIFCGRKSSRGEASCRAVGRGNRTPQGIGYLRAKLAQENLIKASGVPYTILHSTQFFEFIDGIIKTGTEGNVVHVPSALVQPIASDDVATALAQLALSPPVNDTIEIAGPDACPLDEFARRISRRKG